MSRHVRLSIAFLLFSGLLSATLQAQEPVEFNPAFFGGRNGKAVDLSRFQGGNALTPGVHQLDLYLNGNHVGRQQVRVRVADTATPSATTPATTAAHADAQPCLPMKVYERIGVNIPLLNAEQAEPVSDEQCVGLEGLPPSSRFDVDMSELRADLSIPQIYIKSTARGYVPPEEWDSGIDAGFLGYGINLSSNRFGNRTERQFFSSTNAGLNLGDWRFRHNGSFSYTDLPGALQRSRYQALSSYAQREVTAASAQLTLGQFYTPGNLFDSMPYTGIQLSSDERMLPDSMRGFAPVVRGVADTTAKVSVRQGTSLLYETTVSPGPFAIDDLYNTGYAGDLDVTITEADGRTKQFVVPYASVAQLLRPGSSRFSVTGGRYRDDTLDAPPAFLQGTYQRGLSDTVTGYGGVIAAQQYRAMQGGVALSTPLGALAADLTQSHATTKSTRSPSSGRSVRLSYSKLVEPTSTNFSVVAYRFSSEGYLSLGEFARLRESRGTVAYGGKERSRLQFNVSQPLGEGYGHVTLAGVAQNYWNRHQSRDTSYYASYSNGYAWGSVNISVSRTRDQGGRFGNQYLLSLNLPLGRGPNSAYLSTSLNLEGNGKRGTNASVSGSAGDTGQFGYNVYGTYNRTDNQGSRNQGGSLRYDTAHANYTLSGSGGGGYRQFGAGMRGTLIAHAGGINATQAQGETMAVLEAPEAYGAGIVSGARGRIGSNGYGVMAGLMPYRRNEVGLDPKGTSRDVELEITSQQVAPRAGAVVLLRYPTVSGRPILLKLVRDRGATIPMGAEVIIPGIDAVTLVGQGGRAFVRGLQGHGQLAVKWGEAADQQCQAIYQVDEQAVPEDARYYPQLELSCTTVQPFALQESAS
ncbi:Heat shock protein E [Achromobacter spanius]|uniref:fimbria/pilus outer membrane usher protein n=1 Tax=Achromobacter spanius TaxID=217203 RepID=UPI000C2C60FD|nr:fimbria/pilus outer membrane usher protein [Achromobacter spanius]AUA55293.1 fimbrial biogenesis outer membrane usher protein [Achromobacter spanius]CAB3678207.1 Outer membrane usher protein HtrE [Achromobacter spanius]SPT38127.1 Heat shock protein E [Achromobacter denitrificans]VEE57247.1 Heat shock protein E [Achromobacter spanius]